MLVLQRFPKGSDLFSVAVPGSTTKRRSRGPTPWAASLFWDPPAKSERLESASSSATAGRMGAPTQAKGRPLGRASGTKGPVAAVVSKLVSMLAVLCVTWLGWMFGLVQSCVAYTLKALGVDG